MWDKLSFPILSSISDLAGSRLYVLGLRKDAMK